MPHSRRLWISPEKILGNVWLPGLSFLPLIITDHLAFGQDMTYNWEFLRATLLFLWENLQREYYPQGGHLVKARTGLFPECLDVILPEDVFGGGWCGESFPGDQTPSATSQTVEPFPSLPQ